jgi:hypothetical protein
VSVTKDQNSRNRDRQQTGGPVPARYPLAGSVVTDFIQVVGGEAGPRPIGDADVPFVFIIGIDEVSVSHLETSGFEGVDLPELDTRSATAAEPAPAETSRPAFASLTAFSAPASGEVTAEYEPMEFLDFDEPLVEEIPEPVPEPEPPGMVVDFLAVPVPFMNAAPAKPVQGISDIPMPMLPVCPPELKLGTIRRRVVSGPNPLKPQPAPDPALKQIQPVGVRQAAAPQLRPAAAASVVRVSKAAPESKPAPSTQEKPKIAVRPAAPTPSAKPSIAARDRGSNALAVTQADAEPAPAPAPKPKLMSIRKVEAVPSAAETAAQDIPFRGIASPVEQAGMSPVLRGSIAAAALVVLGLGGYFGFSGKSSSASSTGQSQSASEITATGMVMGGGGWTTTWGSDSPVNQNKQISIYRPSMALTDYRLEFRGQIDRKALGWIFRASNARNYYVMKLEMIKAGANPIVALMKYAVIDGKETTRTQIMLPFDVALDTIYSVRLDVKGDKFATYIQNKLVDHWTDDRIKAGGTGFYSDKGERAQIKSSQVSYLTASR